MSDTRTSKRGLKLAPGQIWWAELDEGVGREQGGRRPVVVVADYEYLEPVDALAIVMPLTTKNRGWPNHIQASGNTGLQPDSWIMTEQVRCVSRLRLHKHVGSLSPATFNTVKWWSSVFFGLPAPK